MHEKVIEPSEIVVEQVHKQAGNAAKANPWVRFLARFFDYSLFFMLLLSSRKLFHGKLPFGQYEHLVPFEFFVWIPIETLLLKLWGSTPGKWFLKTKLKAGKKQRLDFLMAMRRSFAVWVRGLGLGIPILNFFCLMIAYHKLKVLQITSWDRDDHIAVTHYPIGKWRIYVATIVAVTGLFYYYSEKNHEMKQSLKSGSVWSAKP